MFKRENLTFIGIALSIVGVPLGMYCNYLFPIVKWSPIFMLFSVLFIASYVHLFSARLPLFNKWFATILFFQFLMLLYGVFYENTTDQYVSFHLYIMSLIIALASNGNTLTYNKIIGFVFCLSSICTVLGALFIWQGLVTGDDYWKMRKELDDYALEAFTVANGAIINFVSILCLRLKKSFFKPFVWILFALDIYTIFMSSKRTPVFVSLIIVCLYTYKSAGIKRVLIVRYLKIVSLFIICGILAYYFIDPFQKLIDKFSLNFYNGVLNILGFTDVRDSSGSAIERFKSRNWAFAYMENNFNFFNYLLGGGYFIRWLDNPLLQSYVDMGILGILLYVYLVLVFPIKAFFKIKNIISLFALLLCVYNLMTTYSSGHPYLYSKYVPIVFLAFVLNLNPRRRPNENRNLRTTNTTL